MNWGCDHDTGFHMRLLVEAAHGKLRRCPTCGATAYGPPYSDFGDPNERWQAKYRRENPTPADSIDRVSRDWSQPRPIPWLPWDHPNYMVTSHREAVRVCRDWGIDPERGGFISPEHERRAREAARRNRRAAIAKFSAADRAKMAASRRRSRAGIGKNF